MTKTEQAEHIWQQAQALAKRAEQLYDKIARLQCQFRVGDVTATPRAEGRRRILGLIPRQPKTTIQYELVVGIRHAAPVYTDEKFRLDNIAIKVVQVAADGTVDRRFSGEVPLWRQPHMRCVGHVDDWETAERINLQELSR